MGNDWDHATARTLGAGQTLVHEWTDTGVGDDFWVQRLTTPTAAAGTPVLVNATAPTTDRWNLSAVEVLATGSGPSSTPTPILGPAPGTYPAALTVTISDAATNATIYYTTDGSPPTSNSNVYVAPLAVNATSTIRAFAVAPGLGPSGVVAGQYVIQAAQLNGHGVVLDAGGKLLSWLPQESAYGRIVGPGVERFPEHHPHGGGHGPEAVLPVPVRAFPARTRFRTGRTAPREPSPC